MSLTPFAVRVASADDLVLQLNLALAPLTSALISNLEIGQMRNEPQNAANLFAAFGSDTTGATPLGQPFQVISFSSSSEAQVTILLKQFIAAHPTYFFAGPYLIYRPTNANPDAGVIGVLVFNTVGAAAAANWAGSGGGGGGGGPKPPVALVDAPVVAINAAASDNFTLLTTAAVGATRQLGAPSGLSAGMKFWLEITQPAAGGPCALTYNAIYKFIGGSPPVLQTAPNAVDLLALYYDGTSIYVSTTLDALNSLTMTPGAVTPPTPIAGEIVQYPVLDNGILREVFKTPDGIISDILSETSFVVCNTSANTLSAGQAVYVSGVDVTSGKLVVSLAKANAQATSRVIGILIDTLAPGNVTTTFGRVMSIGTLRNQNTSITGNFWNLGGGAQVAAIPGLPYFLSDVVAGGLTQVVPGNPGSYTVQLGAVRTANATTGIIEVRTNTPVPVTALNYQGTTWSPVTNNPTLSDATGIAGQTYFCSGAAAGPIAGLSDGSMAGFHTGDVVTYIGLAGSGGKWVHIFTNQSAWDNVLNPYPLTDAATVAIDAKNSNNFTLLLTAAVGATRVIGTPTNLLPGMKWSIAFTQPASGGPCAVTFNAPYLPVNGLSPVLQIAAGATDIIDFYWDGSILWIGKTLNALNSITKVAQTSSPGTPALGKAIEYINADTNGTGPNQSTYYRPVVRLPDNTFMDLDADTVFIVCNTGAAQLNAGQAVYVSGVDPSGTKLAVSLAKADAAATSRCIGILMDTLPIGNGVNGPTYGRVVVIGTLRNQNNTITGNFWDSVGAHVTATAGSPYFLSDQVAGGLTQTAPTNAASYIVQLGAVRSVNAATGIMEMRATTPVPVAANAFAQPTYSAGNSGVAVTINWANGYDQKLSLTANTTITFTGTPAFNRGTLRTVQPAGQAYTVTWPANVRGPNGTRPQPSSAALSATNITDMFAINYDGVAAKFDVALAMPNLS